MEKNKNIYNSYENHLTLNKSIKLINKNKDLENIIQDINNINSNLIRYNQIENLLKSDIKIEKEVDSKDLLNYLDKIILKQNIKGDEKQKLFGDCKQLCKKVYSPIKTIEAEKNMNPNKFCIKDIKPYNNSIKEAMNSIFKGNDVKIRNKIFPLNSIKLNNKDKINLNLNLSKKLFTNSKEITDRQINNRNGSQTDRAIKDNNSSKKLYLPRTLETDRRINISYGNYASNNIRFNHPQFYILNNNHQPVKKKLPPIRGEKLNTVDLLRKNNSHFNMLLNKKREQIARYYLALRMKEIAKFKIVK